MRIQSSIQTTFDEEKVESILKSANCNQLPVDLLSVANKLSIRLMSFLDDTFCLIEKKIIFINLNTIDIPENRFALAHEMAHIIWDVHSQLTSSTIEIEHDEYMTNKRAADLLIPISSLVSFVERARPEEYKVAVEMTADYYATPRWVADMKLASFYRRRWYG